MSKFGGFFARKAGLFDNARARARTPTNAPLPDNPLELDEELFSALGAQIGGDNESLRNLLLDANAKIGELDTIKAAVGKLVDPVSKTLRAFEAEKSEKISLQTVLNNTRTAYGKLRNEVAELEKKAAASDSECRALRQELTTTQNLLRTAEATKAEIAIDIAARRAQIIDLEARLAQETGENKALREENRRLDERLAATDKRIIALESDLNAARQRLMAEDEKRAQQTSLDKASAEAARLSRKLAETEASLNAAQGRLRHVEANFAEVNNERARLVTALDEANERHEHELTSQRMRFDALQARADRDRQAAGRGARASARPRRGYPRIRPAHRRHRHGTRWLAGARVRSRSRAHQARIRVQGDRSGPRHLDGAQRHAGPRLHRQGSGAGARRGRQSPRSTSGSPRWRRRSPTRNRAPKTPSRSSTRRFSARSWNARWWKARWRPAARTSPA